MKKSTATIENITPPTERDLGGVRVSLVEVTFRLDEHDDQSSIATQVCFEDLDKVLGISHDTARLLKLDWSKSVFPVENGVFVAALPADPGWMIGKRFSVITCLVTSSVASKRIAQTNRPFRGVAQSQGM